MQKKIIKTLLYILIALVVFTGFYFLSRYNYLLFHFTIEFASIAFGICLFIIPVSTTYLTKNMFMILIGSTLFTSSVLDFLHTVSFSSFNVFAGHDSNLSLQLWTSARLFQIIGIFTAVFLIERLLSKKSLAVISIIIPVFFASLVSAIFLKLIPQFVVEDPIRLSLSGRITDYVTVGFGLLSMMLYTLRRKRLGSRNYFFIFSAISCFSAGQILLIFNINFSVLFEIIAHFLKLLSLYFMYNFLIETNLRDPYKILINNLKGTSEKLRFVETHDSLTGFLNQPTMIEELKKQYEISKRFNKDFSVIMIDIDNIKEINNKFGHPAGDEALKYLAGAIKNSVRDVDIKGRYGGDEFIVSPIEVSSVNAIAIAQKIQANLGKSPHPAGIVFGKFHISAGISGTRDDRQFDEIIARAYKAMLKSKKLGKNRITLIR